MLKYTKNKVSETRLTASKLILEDGGEIKKYKPHFAWLYILSCILLFFPVFSFAETGDIISRGTTAQSGVITPQYAGMCTAFYQLV